MEFSHQRLTQSIVANLLKEAENSFTPPLSRNIPYTVEDYACKLSNNASFVLCADGGEIVGFTAYYLNDGDAFAYIPQIWVSIEYQRNGIGSLMIDELVKNLPKTIKTIRLEVRRNNTKALSFYMKHGFSVVEEKNGKCVMEKYVKK